MNNNVVTKNPLIVIVGETGSGKSALGIALAERLNGEIICADSRTVYRGMDIGTAKPSATERSQVQHYGLDLVAPNERFTVADFKRYAMTTVDFIHEQGKIPMLVGGTGLYIDAVLYNYQFRSDDQTADWAAQRADLSGLSVEELQFRIREQHINMPVNDRNPRHLVRALETGGAVSARSELRSNTLILGLRIDREVLRARITARVDLMLKAGFVEEVQTVSQMFGWDCEALRAPGYRAFRGYLEGDVTLEQAKTLFVKNDMDLAKRQRTWFKRNKSIHWLSTQDKLTEAVDIATTFLNK